MSIFKDLKDDLSRTTNHILPEDVQEQDEAEQMVNTLDAGEFNEIASEKMKEWLNGLTSGDTFKETSQKQDGINEDTRVLYKEAINEDEMKSENELIDEYGMKSGNEFIDEDEMKSENDLIDQDEMKSENDLMDEDEVEIENEFLDEDELELRNKLVNENKEQVENKWINEEENESMDDNVDLELLNSLNKDHEEETRLRKAAGNKVKAASIARDNEETVVTKGTTINGSISTDGSLDIMGTVNGDVICLGKLSVTGKVNGNLSAADIYVNTERIEGSIQSDGNIKIGLGTVVIGDVKASSGIIAGAVKGEIDINGPIVIDSTAIIKGNIKAKSIQINNGAIVEGYCSLSYAAVDIDSVFE